MIDCKNYALKLLSFKDRTEKEIRTKLTEKGYEENEAEEVIDFLKAYGYVNDLRYAENFVADAVKIKKWGRKRIENELLMRGIPRDIIAEIPDCEADEEMLIKEEMEKRFSNADLGDRKVKMRIISFFIRRGFQTADIYRVINSVCSFEDIESEYI